MLLFGLIGILISATPSDIPLNTFPWIAVYVETSDSADVYLTSLKNYDEKYRGKERKAIDDWKMGKKYKELYKRDPGKAY